MINSIANLTLLTTLILVRSLSLSPSPSSKNILLSRQTCYIFTVRPTSEILTFVILTDSSFLVGNLKSTSLGWRPNEKRGVHSTRLVKDSGILSATELL
jgi:hypothetical protein